MLPKWMSQTQMISCPCCSVKISGRDSYLNKAIKMLRGFMVETFLHEKSAGKNGLLQVVDSRLKLVITLILVFLLSLTHYVLPILAVYLSLLILAYFSKLKVLSLMLRSILTVGFFSVLVMLPATLNIFIPGEAILKLPVGLAVTDNGLNFLLLFSARALTMTSSVLLLLLTTKREQLLSALGALRIPSAFIMIIAMSYRFMLSLVKVVENLHLARKSRTIKLDRISDRNWVASRIGWVFAKTFSMSNEINQAMISRGWQGE